MRGSIRRPIAPALALALALAAPVGAFGQKPEKPEAGMMLPPPPHDDGELHDPDQLSERLSRVWNLGLPCRPVLGYQAPASPVIPPS